MPHLVILYTPNLDKATDMTALCRTLADGMLAVRDDEGKSVYPPGGTRVLAYPAAHYAVSDGGAAGKAAGGDGDYAFVYLNVRMAKGRSDATKKRAGEALLVLANRHFEQLLKEKHMGITLQIDEGHESFDGKLSSLHPLFR